MKALLTSLAWLVLLAFFFAPEKVRAQDNPDDQGVSFQTFYDQLGDQGTWVQTDDYGYVFQPNVSDPDWAPYTQGRWVSTDEGWTWVSDEPWGWATYHYGRWANIDDLGWVWVPGYRWAPAWVSWRYGGGYAGWAPLPPETLAGSEYEDSGVQVGAGFHFGDDVDVSFHIGPGYYNFIRVEDMGESNYRGRFANRSNNFVIINSTTNITNINMDNNRGHRGAGHNFQGITAGGPALNEVNAHSRQHVQTVQLTQSNQAGKSTLQGNSLAVFAPKVNPATAHQAKPSTVGQTIHHPTFNRGDSITRPPDVTAKVKAAPPTPDAIQSAQKAEATAPARAKIATEKNPGPTTLSKPLTSMAPVASETPPKSTSPGVTPTNASAVNQPMVKPTAQPQVETQQQGNQQAQQQQAQAKQESRHQQDNQQAQQQQAQTKQESHQQQQSQQEQQAPRQQPKPDVSQQQPQQKEHSQKQEQKEAPKEQGKKDAPKDKSSDSSGNNAPGH